MKCENCGHMVSDGGYEYPEYYCELGIADNPNGKYSKYDTGDGCSCSKKKRIAICREYNEMTKDCDMAPNLWWDESKEADHAE